MNRGPGQCLINEVAQYNVIQHPWKLHKHLYSSRHREHDVIMNAMASRIPSLTIVYSTFIQAQAKENIKASRHWPLCGEFTGDRWIPRTKGQYAENVSIWRRHHAKHDAQDDGLPILPKKIQRMYKDQGTNITKENKQPWHKPSKMKDGNPFPAPWASYQIRKIAGCACAGNAGNVQR